VKVTQYRKVFERLMAGETIDQIRRDISSDSSLQRGIQMYVEQWRKDMPEFQRGIRDLELRQKGLEDDLQRVSSGVRDAEITKEDLERDLKVRRDEVDELDIRSVEVKSELDALISKLDSLRERGVNEEVLLRVGTLDFGSGDELLERISTVERHNELVRSDKHFSEALMEKSEEYKDLQRQIESTRELRDFEKNALDEAVRSRTMYLGANKVVQGFLDAGYDTKLLLSLLETLRGLSVKGEPNTSIQRLTDGLSQYRRLIELENAITEKETEVSMLDKRLAESQATLKAIEDSVLKVIDKAKDESIRMIKEQGGTALKLSRDLLDNYKTSLTSFSNAQTVRLEEARQRAEDDVTRVGDSALNKIREASGSLDGYIKGYEKAVHEWGEMREKQGRLKDYVKYGEIIHDIYENETAAKEIPLEILHRLVHTVMYWVYYNDPDAETSPDAGTMRVAKNLTSYRNYKVLALMDMITKYFTTQALEVT
jgi:hypothetical protein